MSDASREGEGEPLRTKEGEPSRVVLGSIPCPMSEERWRKPNEEVYTRRQPMCEERWRKPNKDGNLRVYTRRGAQHEHQEQVPCGGEVHLQGEQHQQQQIHVGDEVDLSRSEP